MEKMSLGQLIRARRKKLDLTIEELAIKVGIDRTYITKIERYGFLPSRKVIDNIVKNLNDNPAKYLRLYKTLKIDHRIKTLKQKIKEAPEKF
jgi:transcriptional regulator with XRE-family HTH domain